jgi:hypothetical protein
MLRNMEGSDPKQRSAGVAHECGGQHQEVPGVREVTWRCSAQPGRGCGLVHIGTIIGRIVERQNVNGLLRRLARRHTAKGIAVAALAAADALLALW